MHSLRGLAAASVVICHATCLLPAVYDHPQKAWWLMQTPLGILRAGHAAVIFFFVLSGYVLSLAFLKGPVPYGSFLVRRICRIWIPYVVAMVAAIGCALCFYPTPVPGLSHWANRALAFPSPALLLNHFLLIGVFANDKFNPVVWSLVYEMRISLVFPLLVLLLRLGAWWRVLAIAAALSVSQLLIERISWLAGAKDLSMTLHYAGLFVLGMVLARDMPRLQARFARFSRWTRALVWLLAFVCYGHEDWLFPHARVQHIPLYRDGLVALGASLFIILALAPSRFSRLLESKGLVFLGRISYSVYLYQAVILLSLAHCLIGKVPLTLIWAAAGMLTLAVATLSYKVIELPAIRLGSFLTRRPKPAPLGLVAVGRAQG